MVKLFSFFLAGILYSCVSYSQTFTQTVKGNITDKDSRSPIPGVHVIVLNSDPVIGSVSDTEGNFRINDIPVGRCNLKLTSIGYNDYYISNLEISSGKEISLVIEMEESVNKLNEVVIRPEYSKDLPINSMASVSYQNFNVEETQRFAASFYDPARMAQSYAGVAAADDENNEIVIRGNSARGLLWRLDGIEIPNPNHFSNGEGDSGGGVSIISNAMLTNSEFFTGAFPAEYGNALSGVFDLNYRSGNQDRHEYSIQAGILGLQASAEGPFVLNHKASFLVNYRYSTLVLLHKAGIKLGGENSLAPRFQDINYKIDIPTKKAGRFSIFGFGGLSDTGDLAVRDSAKWDSWSDKLEETEDHKTGVLAVSHFYLFPDNRTSWKNILETTYERSAITQDTLDLDYRLNGITSSRFSYGAYRFSSELNHKFSRKLTTRNGFTGSRMNFSLYNRSMDWDQREPVTYIDQTGNSYLIQIYSAWQLRISDAIKLNSGIHYFRLMLNGNSSLEPRFSATWQVNESQAFVYGFGIHSRIEPLSIYLAEAAGPGGSLIRPNRDLELTKAIHNVLGYNWTFSDSWKIKLETYYQYLFDVPVAADSSYISAVNYNAGFTAEKFISQGKAYNYGVELTLNRFLTNGAFMMFTTSLFNSKYKALDGILRNTRFNANYIFNWLGGKEFRVGKEKHNIIGVNSRLIWRGGYRVVPVDLEASVIRQETVYLEEKAFEERAPDYFRIDFGINYRKNLEGYSWTLSLDLQNLTNRLNLYEEYFSVKDMGLRRVTYNGLVPNLNFKIDF